MQYLALSRYNATLVFSGCRGFCWVAEVDPIAIMKNLNQDSMQPWLFWVAEVFVESQTPSIQL